MSQRRELEQQLRALRETGEIMNSMKSLALMESRKLLRYLDTQQQVVTNIETMANDFRSHYPITPSMPEDSAQVVVLLGSERGFCGDFNNALLRQFDELSFNPPPQLIVVGRKLCMKIADEKRNAIQLAGAGIAEETPAVLQSLIDSLSQRQQQGAFRLTVLHHRHNDSTVQITPLLPPFQQPATPPGYSHPPQLNLSAERFFTQLLEEYLFAALHQLFYTSLMAENHRRMQHLEGATRRLDEQSNELALKRNVLRQEEITEEIEVILLSATAMEPAGSSTPE